MAEPEIFQDHEKSFELNEKMIALKNNVEEYMEEWTTLQEEI